jgi:hypothetical protein
VREYLEDKLTVMKMIVRALVKYKLCNFSYNYDILRTAHVALPAAIIYRNFLEVERIASVDNALRFTKRMSV